MRRLTALALALLLTGCAQPASPVASGAQAGLTSARARAARDLSAGVLRHQQVPQSVIAATLPRAQATADAASRKRQIDFFTMHAAPVGLRVGAGEQAGYVLSYLGTSKERTDLNIELRALYAPGQFGAVHNYSGPVTLGRSAALGREASEAGLRGGVTFELLMGLPGNGVTDVYADYMTALGRHLVRRYGARPFAFDDAPVIFAVHEAGALTGFVFTNQGNRLVLGDRKYADVQSVVHLSAEAELLGAYTLVGFNEKTPSVDAAPAYRYDADARLGLIAEFGDL